MEKMRLWNTYFYGCDYVKRIREEIYRWSGLKNKGTNLFFKCNLPRQLNICSMKLYYRSPIFGKDALTSNNAVTIGGKNTATSSQPVDSIFTIGFLERIIQFNVLDLLSL